MIRQRRCKSLSAILRGLLLVSLVLNLPAPGRLGSAFARRAVQSKSSSTNSAEATVLFTIGLHIEPLGATPSEIIGGGPPINPQGPNYHNQTFFQRHVQDIQMLISIVERHGGRMTVQAQTPFTRVAAQSGETILADLEARGHEIGLHFHEDAHLGRNPERLPVETWAAVMSEEIGFIHQAGLKNQVRYWSGGNLYPGILEAAARAGLDVQSDWKNPTTQTTDPKLLGVNSWRPAAGPSAADVTGYAQHDPAGKIIFLPEGNDSRIDFASARRSGEFGGDEGYFNFLKGEFQRSLNAARPDRVNVCHFTVHAGEFRGNANQPFAVIDQWLTEMIDPLVKTGRVRWATFSEMADAFKAWEEANPGVDPRGSNAASLIPEPSLTKLATVGVADRNPARALIDPDGSLRPNGEAFKAFTHWHFDCGRATASALHAESSEVGADADAPLTGPYGMDDSAMAVIYHECCADPNNPFEYREGLLARPSDCSVTRWSVSGGPTDVFWWNMLMSRHAAEYNPTNYLISRLALWQGSRPPFITSLIHENNFSRQGPESWTSIYYSADRRPLSPPYDLNAPDPSRPRSPEEQAAIWAAYEQMVAYAAAHWRVVTSEDIVALARAEQDNSAAANLPLLAGAHGRAPLQWPENVAQGGRVDRDATYCIADGVALKMDIYYPMNASGPAPVAMYVHGGGWASGDKSQGAGVRDIPELVARGYLVAAINYRLAPQYKFPAMIEDCKCAVRFLHANAARYNLNPDRIGAWGGSAGGHLVSLLGLTDASARFEGSSGYTDQSSRVQAVVDMFGPTDLTVLFNGANPRTLERVFGTTDRSSETVKRASPVTWVSSDDPPFLILHGELDDLVPPSQSQLLYDRLIAAGVPATLVLVKNAGHGFAPVGGPISPTRPELTRMIADFFDRHLK
ncbi:MAG: alpha/beta hydrolase [Acidobacteria bacterium]|nr:alpha/beta hydrolase [Acidobacteriota bacterium]